MGSYVSYSNFTYYMDGCKIKMKNKKERYNFLDIAQIILTIALIIFSLVILYQIIMKIFGG